MTGRTSPHPPRPRVPMLRRKLWADTWRLARDATPLMVLVALGVLLFIGLHQSYQNLTSGDALVYRTARFADASVLFERGPESLVERAKLIPHVTDAMGRMVQAGAIVQPGKRHERVQGRFISVPERDRARINDVWLARGRYLSNADEVVLENEFAIENHHNVGDKITCSWQSIEREFTVVGIAASPEYIYQIPSKHVQLVARGTFGVVFVSEARTREWFGVRQ